MRNDRLRPSVSAKRPLGARNAASTIVYTLRTHATSRSSAGANARCNVGKAIVITHRSKAARNCAEATTPAEASVRGPIPCREQSDSARRRLTELSWRRSPLRNWQSGQHRVNDQPTKQRLARRFLAELQSVASRGTPDICRAHIRLTFDATRASHPE